MSNEIITSTKKSIEEEEDCTERDLRTAYKICEKVETWHLYVAEIAFSFTLFVSLLIIIVSILIWKYRHLTLIKFRSPMSIVHWGIYANIYHCSRLLYCGILLNWFPYSHTFNIIIYCIRLIGVNGVLTCYVARAWWFYIVYKYDQVMLKDNKRIKQHWIVRYYGYVANESFILKCGAAYTLSISCILTVVYHLEGSTQDFSSMQNAVTFVLILLLLVLLPKRHDQLGIMRELFLFFVVAILAIIGAVYFSLQYTKTTERVLTWSGALLLNATCTLLTFYIPFIYYKQIDHVFNRVEKQEYDQNFLALAKCLSTERGYHLFRKFLCNIYCAENLDFFILVSIYRKAMQQAKEVKVHPVAHSKDKSNMQTTMALSIDLSGIDSPSIEMSTQSAVRTPSDGGIGGGEDLQKRRKTGKNHSTPDLRTAIDRVTHAVDNLLLKDHPLVKDPMDSVMTVGSDGSRKIDLNKLDFPWVTLPEALQNLPIENWTQWIFEHYIDRDAIMSINISDELRDEVAQAIKKNMLQNTKILEESKEDTIEHKEDKRNEISQIIENPPILLSPSAQTSEPSKNKTALLIGSVFSWWESAAMHEVFDRPQKECWNLMVRDSFLHFTTSAEYAQYTQFT